MLTLGTGTASSGTLRLLHDGQFIHDLLPFSSNPADGVLRLVCRRQQGYSGGHGGQFIFNRVGELRILRIGGIYISI